MRSTMMAVIGCLILLMLGHSAWALELQEAKAKGLVGETSSGYLAALTGKETEPVRALVDSINNQRREEYEQIAARNKLNIQEVEQLAGKKAVEKTAAGHFVQVDGVWRKK